LITDEKRRRGVMGVRRNNPLLDGCGRGRLARLGEMPKRGKGMYRMSHERCLTSSGLALARAAPQFLCEGVEPWGAAEPRPSRRRWPGS
jgi:hypothetical protein